MTQPNHAARRGVRRVGRRGHLDQCGDHPDTELRKSQEGVRVELMSTPEDRVRQVIADSGVSQGDFAAEVGLDPSKMSKSLSGARRFSSLDLARIAEIGHVSVDWLLSGEEPVLATAARAAAGSSAETAVAEATRLVELRASAARLGYPQPWQPLPTREESSHPAAQGQARAEEALGRMASMGLSLALTDLADAVERAFGVDVCLTRLGGRFDGLAASTVDAKVILAGLTPVALRQRFTIAHELGHLLAGDDQEIHTDQDIYSPDSRQGDSEVRANNFAAAFLMPEAELRAAVDADFDEVAFAELAMHLKVTPTALAIRLETLRLIDGMKKEQWRSLSAKQAARLAGAQDQLAAVTAYATEPRGPGLLTRDLFTAYLDEKTTLRPYAQLVGVDPNALRDDLERAAEQED